MGVSAYYFDGKISRRFHVEVAIIADTVYITGDIKRELSFNELRISERAVNTMRKISLPDGAYLEIQDNQLFNALLSESSYREPAIIRLQQSWRGTLFVLIFLLALLVGGYLYGLPFAARIIADHLPLSVERGISVQTLAQLDQQALKPSTLTAERRIALSQRFRLMVLPQHDAVPYNLVFRQGNMLGANAFALPSGDIVITDEIINQVGDNDALIGVLAHELGHLHAHHMMRDIIQSSTVGTVLALWFGNTSATVALIPTTLLNLKYSRDAEREADDYAIATLRANHISPAKFAMVFEKLGNKGDMPIAYLNNHPTSAERIAHIMQAQ